MAEEASSFTTRMRKATRKIHSISDALVNAKFAISLRDEKVWAGGLFVFYHVFGYLEDARERLNMPDYNSLFFSKVLFRKRAFEDDLEHYLGENWSSCPKSAALENYLQHLQDLEQENPRLLMAYVYHLYLGLLSGGQILAKKRKMFGDKNATNITYTDKVTDFTGSDMAKLKSEFKNVMDKMADNMSENEKLAFIEESNQVFLMNNLIVNSVGGQDRVIKDIMMKVGVVIGVLVGVVMAYKLIKDV